MTAACLVFRKCYGLCSSSHVGHEVVSISDSSCSFPLKFPHAIEENFKQSM